MGKTICLLRKPKPRGNVGVRGRFFGYIVHFLPYHSDDRCCCQQGKTDHDKDWKEQARPDGLSCGSLFQIDVAFFDVILKATVPVVLTEIVEENLFQLLLTIAVERILAA